MKKSLMILVVGICLSSFANAVNVGNNYYSVNNVQSNSIQISKHSLLLADEDCSSEGVYTPECQFGV